MRKPRGAVGNIQIPFRLLRLRETGRVFVRGSLGRRYILGVNHKHSTQEFLKTLYIYVYIYLYMFRHTYIHTLNPRLREPLNPEWKRKPFYDDRLGPHTDGSPKSCTLHPAAPKSGWSLRKSGGRNMMITKGGNPKPKPRTLSPKPSTLNPKPRALLRESTLPLPPLRASK